jgi:hypothetical protein
LLQLLQLGCLNQDGSLSPLGQRMAQVGLLIMFFLTTQFLHCAFASPHFLKMLRRLLLV